jgi:hypothetical protein
MNRGIARSPATLQCEELVNLTLEGSLGSTAQSQSSNRLG